MRFKRSGCGSQGIACKRSWHNHAMAQAHTYYVGCMSARYSWLLTVRCWGVLTRFIILLGIILLAPVGLQLSGCNVFSQILAAGSFLQGQTSLLLELPQAPNLLGVGVVALAQLPDD